MNQFRDKLEGTLIRFMDVFRLFPIRLYRIFKHVVNGSLFFLPSKRDNNLSLNGIRVSRKSYPTDQSRYVSFALWWSELVYYILDVFGVPEIYETVLDWTKYNSRSLYPSELALAKSIFRDSINYKRVRIDNKAYIGCKHWRFLYVSFYTINSWGNFSPDYLIHELVHVWQFQKVGGAYIPRAIKAINSREGYNYGGVEKLQAAIQDGKPFLDFNYEQQADIITDYYRIVNGTSPQWGKGTFLDLPIYKEFVQMLH